MQAVARRLQSKSKHLLKAIPFPLISPFPSQRRSFFDADSCGCLAGRYRDLERRCSKMAQDRQDPKYVFLPRPRVPFTSYDVDKDQDEIDPLDPSDAESIYFRILRFSFDKDVEPPHGLLWLMIENCKTYYHIRLLFIILGDLRSYKASDGNAHMCQEITRACIRCGALDFGMSTMCASNGHGLMPNIGSANLLLNYAKDRNDVKLMAETFKLITVNKLPLEPDTAEIIFRICRNVDDWELISKYSKKFISAGVKLHHSSYEILMEFAAKIGDVDCLRKFERVRSKQITKKHTFRSGFSYAKGLLLQGKAEEAAEVVIKILRQFSPVIEDYTWGYFYLLQGDECTLTEEVMNELFSPRRGTKWRDAILSEIQKPVSEWPKDLMIEIEKLVKQWPTEFINGLQNQPEKKEEYATTLKSCIPKMVDYLSTNGAELKLNLKHLNRLGK